MLRVATVARRAAAGSAAASAASAPRRSMSAAAAAAAGEDGGKRRRQPLKLEGNLGKYAHSLFNVAKEAKVEAKVAQDLQKIAADFAQPAFVAYLKNPVLSAADLEEKVKEWSKSPAAKGLAEPTVKLVLAMAHRGHLLNLPKVADAYRALLRDAQGIVPARVTSAIALTPKQVQALEAALKKRLDADQTVELTQVVDPSILGGLKVVLGNQFCDMSAASRLRSYDAWLRSQPYEWFDSKVKQLLQGKPLPADQLPYK